MSTATVPHLEDESLGEEQEEDKSILNRGKVHCTLCLDDLHDDNNERN